MPSEALERIYTVNLGVKADERVLVFTDLIGENEDISGDERGRREALAGIAGDGADVAVAVLRKRRDPGLADRHAIVVVHHHRPGPVGMSIEPGREALRASGWSRGGA